MRSVTAVALAGALSLVPLPAAPASQATTASVAGTTICSTGQALAYATVQLRNLATGQIAGSTTSSLAGEFIFTGLSPGNFAAEVLTAAGQVVGTGAVVKVATGAVITGVTVTATAVTCAAAGGAPAGDAVRAAGTAGARGLTTASLVAIAAASAGIVAAVAIGRSASPSQ